MDKRVYGILGIRSIMANWNADFTGYPKSLSSDNRIFGSDKAFKFPIKKMWDSNGEKVLYIKSFKIEEGKKEAKEVRPKSLKERYEEIFEVKSLGDEKNHESILKNLFSATDVKNFGATFAEEGCNFSITGAVQIGQGFNKYENTSVEEQQILSPFRDGKSKEKSKDKEEAKSSTIGTKIVSSEARYFYPFVISPNVYKDYVNMGVTNGYTYDDYLKFKEASLTAATAYNTNSKLGCENELGIFIETDKDLYIPDLCQYIDFYKDENKNVISFRFNNLLDSFGTRIHSIEVYYNSLDTEIENKYSKAKYFNIFTREEI